MKAAVRVFARSFLFAWISLAGLFWATSVTAAPTDCVDDAIDGRTLCLSQNAAPLAYSLCDEAAGYVARYVAWCDAIGGTWMGLNSGGCVGGEPHSEENLVQHSVDFARNLYGVACSVSGDTGWNATFSSNWCLGGIGAVYNSGYLVRDSRRLTITCEGGGGETVNVLKSRTVNCPIGYTSKQTPRGSGCTKLIEPCCGVSGDGGAGLGSGTAVGNPVTPSTGTKVAMETDYRHARGLSFSRYYHSYEFTEPYTTQLDGHTDNQLGIVWRSNWGKRVIPITGTAAIGLSQPNGDVQYFNTAFGGSEIFNNRPGKGRLIADADGYVYLGVDETEIYRPDGRLVSVARRTGETYTLTYSDGTATGPNGGYTVHPSGEPSDIVLPANLLIRVTDGYGNTLSFKYNYQRQVVVMIDPSGNQTRYSYDTKWNLASVTYPDGRTRKYLYNEVSNIPGNGAAYYDHKLTSIIDENGALFATYKYEIWIARAISTEHAGGAQRYQVGYSDSTGTVGVTDPLGVVRTYTYQKVDGILRLVGVSQPGGEGFGAGIQNRTFDAVGNVLSQTDFNGLKTCYAYDAARNLETVRVEGVTAATNCAAVVAAGAALPAGSRKITTEWHPRWNLQARVSEPGRLSAYVYNGGAASCAPPDAVIAGGSSGAEPIAVPCAKTVQATTDANGSQGFAAAAVGPPRTWRYTYNAHGLVLSADGPRTDAADVTTYTYYADDDADLGKRGNVATITNALGHTTSITGYNAHGQPLTIVDPNGVTTTLAYDARQRLVARSVGTETTSYAYDGVGQLVRVTLPDGSYLAYSYDAAHRLTGMADSLGNSITYTLDAMGNRTQEEVRDPSAVLAQTRSRVYNNLNRLFQEVGAAGQTTEYGYDNQGNVISVKDPLNRVTSNQYDALNRLAQVTDPALGVTAYGYNGQDALTGVTDPRGLVTGYSVDGLGNLVQQSSPDTGITVNAYDAAGNLVTQVDAKAQATTYAYDALNRVTGISFADGSQQTYAYDQGPNALGRLSGITETDAAARVTSQIAYGYDPHGRVVSESRMVAGYIYTVTYSYDAAGRLAGMTYPSGRSVTYAFDGVGRIAEVATTADTQTQVVVQQVQYQPFGGVKSYVLGNGQQVARTIDLDGRIAGYTLGGESYAISFDAASRITGIAQSGNPAGARAYDYDSLDRLTSAVVPGAAFGYSYDPVGNRLTKSTGAGTDAYTYSPTSNRIASVTPAGNPARSFAFDANGSTTDDGVNLYSYDARGRMVGATNGVGATAYQVNALGQRIRKTNIQGDTVFHYDTRGHLIAETDAVGNPRREIIYLGDIPVGVVQ